LSYGLGEKKEHSADLIRKINEDYAACLTRDPVNPDAWLSLIANNILLHNWDEAISRYGESWPFISGEQDKLTRSWLGCLALAFAGDAIEKEDTEPLYDVTIKGNLDPHITKAVNSLLNEIKDIDGYKVKWEKAMQIHELFINHLDWKSKGNQFYELRQYKKAINAYEKAIELEPDNPIVWFNKGLALREFGRYDEALVAFDKGLESRNELHAWLNKRDLLVKLCRYEDALNANDKVIELNPKFGEKKETVAFLCARELKELGRNLAELGRYAEAFKALDKAIAIAPAKEKLETVLSFFRHLANLGRYEEAFKAFDKAIELAPDNIEKGVVALVCASELEKLGRHEEAGRLREDCLNHYLNDIN